MVLVGGVLVPKFYCVYLEKRQREDAPVPQDTPMDNLVGTGYSPGQVSEKTSTVPGTEDGKAIKAPSHSVPCMLRARSESGRVCSDCACSVGFGDCNV